MNSDYYFEWGDPNYIEDERYCIDMMESIRAYNIIEKDLIDILDYIEPSVDNFNTYSHRVYELLLRVCTEFESNAKKILLENWYIKKGELNIEDYYKINNATKLSEYTFYLNTSSTKTRLTLSPFSEWTTNHSLKWYKNYNLVKHNRYSEFRNANLGNLLNATSWLFWILFSQFYTFSFSRNLPLISWYQNNRSTKEEGSASHLFSVVMPQSWKEEEMYWFDWTLIKGSENPTENFQF